MKTYLSETGDIIQLDEVQVGPELKPAGELVAKFMMQNGVASGGNWCNWLMSAIRNGLPQVYAAMPDKTYTYAELVDIVIVELAAQIKAGHENH